MPEDLPQDRKLRAAWLASSVGEALDEDLGGEPGRDVTTYATIAAEDTVQGDVVMRQAGVIAGVAVIKETLGQIAERLSVDSPHIEIKVSDGDSLHAGDVVASVAGSGRVVLVAERTILNYLSRASGIATHTRQWVNALEGTGVRVADTRKTTPSMRELEKYAVRVGGGVNKRFGLHDVAMVKDNHIVAAGSIGAAVAAIRDAFPDVPIQVEVESPEQAEQALAAGVRFLLLDNMSPAAMTALVEAVRSRESELGSVRLEATGGLTVATVREVAATGVDFVSVGALTHSSPIVDIGLDLH